jgi:hypothetical protein
MLQRDLAASVAMAATRRSSILASQARMKSDQELCGVLLQQAIRRGEREINWPEYFRNVGFGL